jgi:oligopeptide transport system substrate-binding protein
MDRHELEAVVISRRALVTTGPLTLAGCGIVDKGHFGNSRAPAQQRLVYLNRSEPASIDPAFVTTSKEINITQCLFAGLTQNDPWTLAPRAALATHYETSAGGRMLTFYLRGNRSPKGTPLPGFNSLMVRPACWSDGVVITAHDFVYSWRRLIDPKAAAGSPYLLYYVRNAKDINAGRNASLEDLGVEAVDDFTLRVEFQSPAPFFLNIVSTGPLAAVPRHVIQGAESFWTRPGRIVVSGPFQLQEWRSYDRVVLRKNPMYFNAGQVRLDEVCLLHVQDGVTNVNLFKAGEADAMSDSVLPPQFLPALQGSSELQVRPALNSFFYAVNTEKPHLNNVQLRYALNMAIDKSAIAKFAGAGRTPAVNFVPPLGRYRAPQQLIFQLQGRSFDVLSYDPDGARALLAAAGFSGGRYANGRPLRIELGYPIRPMGKERSEIVQQSWRRHLGIEVPLAPVEYSVWTQTLSRRKYEGVMEVDWTADYADPDAFLAFFTSTSPTNASGWRDASYDDMLASANAEADPAVRMKKLGTCEEHLLKSMPFIPLYFDKWTYLQRQFVRGLEIDPLAGVTFQSAWIDTGWRPAA